MRKGETERGSNGEGREGEREGVTVRKGLKEKIDNFFVS